jgi:hypothetical protein
VVEAATGKEVLAAQMDPQHLSGIQQIRLVRDAANFYVLTSGAADPRLQQFGGVLPNLLPGTGMRSIPVNGMVYAFDRARGQIAWRAEAPSQMLLLEQFADLPFLVFTSRYVAPNKFVNGQPTQVVAVRVIDKRTGKMLYDQSMSQNTQQFHTLTRDDATEAVELVAYNVKVRLTLEK